MLHVPIEFTDRIRFHEREELGYLIAYQDTERQDIAVTNMTKPVRGDFTKVSSDNSSINMLNKFFKSNRKFTAVPYHTHSMEGPSEGDLRTFQQLEDSGIVYYAIGTPTRTLFFRVFRGITHPIKYRLVTNPSKELKNLSGKTSSRLTLLGIESYSL